jgi:hypothetical protein
MEKVLEWRYKLMNTRRLYWILVPCILMVGPLLAYGQDFAYKGGAYGGLGYGRFYDDEGSLGSGLTYRVGAEWRPWRRVGFEAELFGIRFNRGDLFHVEGNTQFVLANATYYFSRSRVQPYVKGGIGAYRTNYTYSWPITMGPVYRASDNGLAVNFGAGVRIFVNRRWSVNPDFRLTGCKGYYSLFGYFSMSAAYHW